MQQKLYSKATFAKAAGVNPSTITRLCSTVLKNAMVGKKIDAAHPDAADYLENRERKTAPVSATGLDPLHEEAIAVCNEFDTYTYAFVKEKLNISYHRARKIVRTMAAAGLVPEKGEKIVITPPPEKIVHVRGTAAAKETRKREAVDDDVVIEIPDNIQAFADMTLRDLIEKFGTDTRFVDWLSATQKIEAINEKRLKNATTEGTLVSRTLVRTGIIEPIDACHIKLLTDGAKTIARRVTAMHSAKRPLDDIEKFVAEQITSFIRPVKAKVAKALKNV